MIPKEIEQKYDNFSKSVRGNDILDPKTTLLIYIASSMAVGCYHWLEHFLGVAEEKGISDDELGTVEAIVMAVSGGRVRAQLLDVKERMNNNKA